MSSHKGRTHGDALAIVGMGCRFPPNADTPRALWDNLCRGVDGIRDIPSDRFDTRKFYDPDSRKPGKMYVRQAGILQQPYQLFDAHFFGMSNKEAGRLDPQQRLLLEVSYECFEDAGIPVDSLKGSRTGVFVGGFMIDSMISSLSRDNRYQLGLHSAVGASMTILSARLSYAFDFVGPSLTIDTACSSSLVAAHYACQSIWRGECDAALICGVNFILLPSVMVALCKAGLLSPDGRCKAFDARANGYARSEGAGVLLMKPLSAALADGNPIYALIRGSAVNHGGHADAGVSVPQVKAQAALIREALLDADVSAQEIAYVEAHGTGTAVGDVVETAAISEVLGASRSPREPLVIGSIKSNIGHTEAAAGVAGLIKAALCLHRREIPPNLHFETPNPNIDFERLRLEVCNTIQEWPNRPDARFAGVNSFGYGGTNAHVILERYEAPPSVRAPKPASPSPSAGPFLLPLSARSEMALRALAGRYAAQISQTPEAFEAIAFGAATRRQLHERRVTVVASSAAECAATLEGFAQGANPALAYAATAKKQRKVAWIYTGMGPQRFGMGKELFKRSPVFRDTLERASAIIQKRLGWSLLDEIVGDESRSRMGATEVAQPANLAIQAALTDLLYSIGLRPDSVMGHSVGELGSAYAAGLIALEDAVELACHRGTVLARASGKGTMLAVSLTPAEGEKLIAQLNGTVSIGAFNGPSSLALSGERAALEKISAQLTEANVFNRMLQVDVPYHSALLDPLMSDLEQRVQGLRTRAPSIPLYSSVTGGRVEAAVDARYWVANMRSPVQFASAMDALLTGDHDVFFEIGPHPVLAESIRQCAAHRSREVLLVPSLQRKKSEPTSLFGAAAQLHSLGVGPDWKRLFAEDLPTVELPSYPWAREFHWVESNASREDRLNVYRHPVLGRRLDTPYPRWEADTNIDFLPFLPDHQVGGEVLMPATGYLEAAVAMCQEVFGEGACVLEDVAISAPLVLGEDPITFHSSLDRREGLFHIYSRTTDDDTSWKTHASGAVRSMLSEGVPLPGTPPAQLRERMEEDSTPFYERLAERQYLYGPTFRQVQRLYRHENEVLAEIQLPETLHSSVASFWMHPATFDACLHTMLALLPPPSRHDTRVFFPVAARRVVFHKRLGVRVFSHARMTAAHEGSFTADFRILDAEGNLLVQVDGLTVHSVAQRSQVSGDLADWAYRYTWNPLPSSPLAVRAEASSWILLGDRTAPVAEVLRGKGHRVNICPTDEDSIARAFSAAANPGRADFWGIVLLAHPALSPKDGLDDCAVVMRIAKQCAAQTWKMPPRIWIVTTQLDALSAQDAPPGVGTGLLLGLVRTWMYEQPAFRITVVDTEPTASVLPLVETLLSDLEEEELALRGDHRFARRFERQSPSSMDHAATRYVPWNARLLELVWRRGALGFVDDEQALKRETTHVSVEEAVVWRVPTPVTQVVPGERPAVVSEVTLAVSENHQTQRRVALLHAGPPKTRLPAQGVTWIDVPEGMRGDQVALALPVAAALRACRDLARVEPGERVLVRLGPDGVGTAVAQLARESGCRVASVMSGAVPVEGAVSDIPTMSLDEGSCVQTLKQMLGGPADVFIDCSGEFVSESRLQQAFSVAIRLVTFARLATGPSGTIARLRLGPNSALFQLDFPQLVESSSELSARLLQEALALVRQGKIVGVHARAAKASQLEEISRQLQSRSFEGPLRLMFREETLPVLPPELKGYRARSNGTYLITGGLSGLGLELGHWLVEHGARHLLLMSRRGLTTPEAKEAVAALRARSVNVVAVSADVTDVARMKQWVDAPPDGLPPICGVVHAAVEFGGGLVKDLTFETFSRLVNAKANGAWTLHQATEHSDLDLFLLVSSIGAAVGTLMNAPYSSSNEALNSLAAHRKQKGLPVLSVGLGPVSDRGVLLTRSDFRKNIDDVGLIPAPADRLFACTEYALERRTEQLYVSGIDWVRMSEVSFPKNHCRRFLHLVEQQRAQPTRKNATASDARALFTQLTAEDRGIRLVAILREEVSRILGSSPDRLEFDVPLNQLGFDSLMSAQLRDVIERQVGVNLKIMTLVRGPTLDQLVVLLQSEFQTAAPDTPAVLKQVEVDALTQALDAVERLSDVEVENALGAQAKP